MCKDQTRLTFQRSYRGNLRCDIKDRRIVSALLTPPRGNSCCFLTRQLYIARKPWIIASSSSSNLWSCSLCLPSDHTVKHLGHDYRFCVGMETDGENELGFSWGGLTQEIYIALKTHCLTNRRWQLYLLAFEAFFALPTSPVFHVPCTVCRRVGFRTLHRCQSTALLQSPTGSLVQAMWCSAQSVPAVSDCTYEGGHITSHLASPGQESCSRQLFSLSRTAKRKECLAPSTTHAVTINTTLPQSPTRIHTTSQLTVFEIDSQLASRSSGDSIIFLASVHHAFVLVRSD